MGMIRWPRSFSTPPILGSWSLGAEHLLLVGPQLDLEQDAGVVDDGGDDGGLDDDGILHAQGLSHDEGRGAHDGGHQLAAHGGGGHHGAGELVGVATLFHQGDGKGTGGHDHGHGGTVDHAQQAGGDDAHLGGAALGAAGDGAGQIVEQLAHAALVHHFTEDDEDDDVSGRDFNGRTVDAVDIDGQVLDDLGPGVAAVHEDTGHVAAEQAVQQEDDAQDGQGRTADPAGGLQHQKHQQGAHDDVQGGGLEAGGHEGVVPGQNVDGLRQGQHSKNRVVPGDLFPGSLCVGGVEHEAQDQDQAHVDGVVPQVHHGQQAGRVDQVVDGKEEAEQGQRLFDHRRIKLAGTSGFFMLFQHGLLLGQFFRRQFCGENIVFFSQSGTTSFEQQFRRSQSCGGAAKRIPGPARRSAADPSYWFEK